MPLTSASTTAEWAASYEDNADYDVPADIAKCRLFITACRVLKRRMLQGATNPSGSSASDTYEKYEQEEKRAIAWLATNDPDAATAAGSGYVRHSDFSTFRS